MLMFQNYSPLWEVILSLFSYATLIEAIIQNEPRLLIWAIILLLVGSIIGAYHAIRKCDTPKEKVIACIVTLTSPIVILMLIGIAVQAIIEKIARGR